MGNFDKFSIKIEVSVSKNDFLFEFYASILTLSSILIQFRSAILLKLSREFEEFRLDLMKFFKLMLTFYLRALRFNSRAGISNKIGSRMKGTWMSPGSSRGAIRNLY
ncbi:MAG: hypothetical protein D6680_20295 [Cyanobacteria bacterium J007]|nr:MAG: hypothetical protein D6680_20295 [Cyanobacteria bacterium J007]